MLLSDRDLVRLLLDYVDFERLKRHYPDLALELRQRIATKRVEVGQPGVTRLAQAGAGIVRAEAPAGGEAKGRDRTIAERPSGGVLSLWTDGAAETNPGPAGIGVVVVGAGGTVLAEIAEPIGRATNNVAEYRALLRGLEEARLLRAAEVVIRSDSELLVRQVNGVYKVKDSVLRRLHAAALDALGRFRKWRCVHVPREANRRADALSKEGIRNGRRGAD